MLNNSTNESLAQDNEDSRIYHAILALLGSLGFLFNGILVFVIWRNKTTEFRSGTSYVIVNLALADCLTGAAVILLSTREQSVEIFQVPMVWTSIEASLISLMFLSIERTLGFLCPFTSRTILTVRRTLFVLTAVWLFSISCGIFVHFYKNPTQLAMTYVFEVCVVVFLFSQGYIIVKMQQRKRKNLFCDRDVSIMTKKRMVGYTMNNHVTKVVLILIVVLVVTLLPYMIAVQIYLLSILKITSPLHITTKQRILQFIKYFYPVELLNFIVNPIIYAYRLKRYRRAFFLAFSFLKCGPFVKARARTLSRSTEEIQHEYPKIEKVLMANMRD